MRPTKFGAEPLNRDVEASSRDVANAAQLNIAENKGPYRLERSVRGVVRGKRVAALDRPKFLPAAAG
jgi:hypothetical protein